MELQDIDCQGTATRAAINIVHRPGTLGAPIAKFDHAYDIRGNLSALTELSGKKTFAYDAIERLTGVTQTIPAPASEVESYAYDPEGNRFVTHLVFQFRNLTPIGVQQ